MTPTYHFIGIGGIGMSALARILLSQKIPVSGSDIAFSYTVEGLIKEGAVVHKGHSSEVIAPHMTVVYSSDIKPDNPEYVAAIKMKCAIIHRSDLLSQMTQKQRSLAVAGTHGKTTTSALLATVLFDAGLDPSFAVGGILPQFQANSRYGKGEYFAFEADESDGSFLKYFPFGAIVTNIDDDHLNNFEGNFEVLITAFKKFMSQVTSPKQHLFWCGDDLHLAKINMPGKKYGFDLGSDWRVFNFRQEGFHILFDIDGEGIVYTDINLPCIGRYNALNATAVFGLAITLGIAEDKIREAFLQFKGIGRRFEWKGEFNRIQFFDDYAHHPTEIKVTLEAIRKAMPETRLIAVFQPHRYSRTYDCLGSYGTIFDKADELIITDIFSAGETPIPNLSHQQIIDEVKKNSSISLQYVSRPALSHMLADFCQPNDLVVTLGAGDITKVASETLNAINRSMSGIK